MYRDYHSNTMFCMFLDLVIVCVWGGDSLAIVHTVRMYVRKLEMFMGKFVALR